MSESRVGSADFKGVGDAVDGVEECGDLRNPQDAHVVGAGRAAGRVTRASLQEGLLVGLDRGLVGRHPAQVLLVLQGVGTTRWQNGPGAIRTRDAGVRAGRHANSLRQRGGWKMLDAREKGSGADESGKRAPSPEGTKGRIPVSQPHSGGTGGLTVGDDSGGTEGPREQFGPWHGL